MVGVAKVEHFAWDSWWCLGHWPKWGLRQCRVTEVLTNLDSKMALASDSEFTVETPSQVPHQAFAQLPLSISVTYPCLSFSFFIYWLINHFSCYSSVSVNKIMQGDHCTGWAQLDVKEGMWASIDGHQQAATATLVCGCVGHRGLISGEAEITTQSVVLGQREVRQSPVPPRATVTSVQ